MTVLQTHLKRQNVTAWGRKGFTACFHSLPSPWEDQKMRERERKEGWEYGGWGWHEGGGMRKGREGGRDRAQ